MNKKDEIYDLLVDGLVNARYRFGQRLLVKELATVTGVSRQPIMTALNRLAADGFVRIIPQVGCQVVSPDRREIADFYLLFQRMEGLLAELAATRRTDREVKDLAAVQRRIVATDPRVAEGAADYAQLNRDFHQRIHDMAGSPLIAEKQRSNFNMSDFFINQSVGFGVLMSDTPREHDAIIEAIASQSPAKARRAAESHISEIAQTVIADLPKAEATAPPTTPRRRSSIV